MTDSDARMLALAGFALTMISLAGIVMTCVQMNVERERSRGQWVALAAMAFGPTFGGVAWMLVAMHRP